MGAIKLGRVLLGGGLAVIMLTGFIDRHINHLPDSVVGPLGLAFYFLLVLAVILGLLLILLGALTLGWRSASRRLHKGGD